MTTKLQHALSLARKGFYVFRLTENTKIPLANIPWREHSTRQEKTITEWFTDDSWDVQPDFNIAIDCAKSGLLVVDVDCKDGKQGKENFAALIAGRPLPETYTVTTPSGGLHYYFIADRFRNTQGDKGGLAPGIDTRGDGGFVVAPGSIIDGKEYTAEDLCFGDIPELPETWCELLHKWKSDSVHNKQSKTTVSSDNPGDVAVAIDFLKNHEPAIEGAGGDHHTFVMFCKLKERGISCENAINLADEHWNPRCSPPWDLADLTRKAQSAYKSAQNATGAHSVDAEFDMPVASVTPQEPNLVDLNDWPACSDIPPREWVFGNLCMRKQVTIIVAPGGSGKSIFTMSLAASKASGKDFLGIDPCGAGRVAVYNNEDNRDELFRRTYAVINHHGIKREDVEQNMIIISGEKRPLRIAKRGENSQRLKPADVEALVNDIKRLNIQILIVDPLAETHPAKENENEEMLEIGRMYRAVAQLANCSVVLVHHTRKLTGASTEGHSGNLDSMRGASSLGGVARVVATFDTMSKRQAKDYGIPEDIAHRYVSLEIAKANMSARADGRRWYEWRSETINATIDDLDGDKIGVIGVVKLTKKKEKVDDAVERMMADLEEVVADAPQTVATIAATLAASFPFYAGSQKSTLEKSIRRTFNASGVMTSPNGTLHIDEPLHGAKTIRFNRLRFDAGLAEDSPAILLL